MCENCQPSMVNCSNLNFQQQQPMPVYESTQNVSSFGGCHLVNSSYPSIDFNTFGNSVSLGNVLSFQNIPKAQSFCKSF